MTITNIIFDESSANKIIENVNNIISGHGYTDLVLSVHELRSYFRESDCNSNSITFYDRNYLTFVANCLVPNYLKYYYVLNEMYHLGLLNRKSKFLDIGSGPGTFSLACSSFYNTYFYRSNFNISIEMVEAQTKFIDVFGRLWNSLDIKNKSNFSFSMVNKYITGSYLPKATPDIIILSNSLIEIIRNSCVSISDFVKFILESNAIVVLLDSFYHHLVDRVNVFIEALSEKYSVKNFYSCPNITFEKYSTKNFYSRPNITSEKWNYINLGMLSYEISYNPIRYINSNNMRFNRIILVPNNLSDYSNYSQSKILVNNYKEAWEKHDTRILPQVFSDDATYQEKPHLEPLNGLNRIVDYWKENSIKQSEVNFFPKYIIERENQIDVHWDSHFYRNDLNKWILLQGYFSALIKNSKIYRFTECFTKKINCAPLI